jgi:hypothetical protein
VNHVESSKFKRILKLIAQKEHTTVDKVRAEMQAAIEEGQQSCDPTVQALWASIPRKGAELTLEEFVVYVTEKARSPIS